MTTIAVDDFQIRASIEDYGYKSVYKRSSSPDTSALVGRLLANATRESAIHFHVILTWGCIIEK